MLTSAYYSVKVVEASAGHLIDIWPEYCQFVGGIIAMSKLLFSRLEKIAKVVNVTEAAKHYREMLIEFKLWIMPISRMILKNGKT